MDYKLNIDHVVGETSFMIGFISRKAVCQAEVILVLRLGVAKPSWIARSILGDFSIRAGSYRNCSEKGYENDECSGKGLPWSTEISFVVWWQHIAGEKAKALRCRVFWFRVGNSQRQYCLQFRAVSSGSSSSQSTMHWPCSPQRIVNK